MYYQPIVLLYILPSVHCFKVDPPQGTCPIINHASHLSPNVELGTIFDVSSAVSERPFLTISTLSHQLKSTHFSKPALIPSDFYLYRNGDKTDGYRTDRYNLDVIDTPPGLVHRNLSNSEKLQNSLEGKKKVVLNIDDVPTSSLEKSKMFEDKAIHEQTENPVEISFNNSAGTNFEYCHNGNLNMMEQDIGYLCKTGSKDEYISDLKFNDCTNESLGGTLPPHLINNNHSDEEDTNKNYIEETDNIPMNITIADKSGLRHRVELGETYANAALEGRENVDEVKNGVEMTSSKNNWWSAGGALLSENEDGRDFSREVFQLSGQERLSENEENRFETSLDDLETAHEIEMDTEMVNSQLTQHGVDGTIIFDEGNSNDEFSEVPESSDQMGITEQVENHVEASRVGLETLSEANKVEHVFNLKAKSGSSEMNQERVGGILLSISEDNTGVLPEALVIGKNPRLTTQDSDVACIDVVAFVPSNLRSETKLSAKGSSFEHENKDPAIDPTRIEEVQTNVLEESEGCQTSQMVIIGLFVLISLTLLVAHQHNRSRDKIEAEKGGVLLEECSLPASERETSSAMSKSDKSDEVKKILEPHVKSMIVESQNSDLEIEEKGRDAEARNKEIRDKMKGVVGGPRQAIGLLASIAENSVVSSDQYSSSSSNGEVESIESLLPETCEDAETTEISDANNSDTSDSESTIPVTPPSTPPRSNDSRRFSTANLKKDPDNVALIVTPPTPKRKKRRFFRFNIRRKKKRNSNV